MSSATISFQKLFTTKKLEIDLNLDDFPEIFDPSRCILFLGAGFSAEAKNKANTHPPVGNGLNQALKQLSKLPEDDTSPLTDTATYALSEQCDVYGLLESLYTIRELTELQRKALSLPWQRIYTTNYDNSVSVYRAETGTNLAKDIFDLTDDAPKQLRKGAVIHLHGSIAKCDREAPGKSLVLTQKSYVEQRVKKSLWWDWFDQDIKVSQYVFFLGYDINDFEPASYLLKYPGTEGRCHFVLRIPSSPVAAKKIAVFGTRHSFGLAGFVERMDRAKIEATPTHERELRSFQYVDLIKDDKLPHGPTSAEVQELLSFGRIRFDALKATWPTSEYAVIRNKALEKSVDELKKSKTLVVHAKIGNGKSVFLDELKIHLSQQGRRCFVLRSNIVPLPQDIDFIKSIRDPVIFFPDYDSAFTNIHFFSELSEEARYVVELPTSTLQVRMQEVQRRLGKVARVDLDKLDYDDTQALQQLLSKAGLTSLSQSRQIKSGLEFRDFLLLSFEDPEIAKRLKEVITPLLQNRASRRLILVSSILKATGLPLDVGFIEEVIGDDPYAVMNGLGEPIHELVEYTMDKIEPHSAVLSEHILTKYLEPLDFIEVILSLASEAARRTTNTDDTLSERFRRARAILSAVIRFGFIDSVIGRVPDRRKIIQRLYESCRQDSLIQTEPLFWLQYSIYWQDEPRWDLAESHMLEAYARAEKRAGFKTYQLDTNYFGLLCDLELNSDARQPVQRIEQLLNTLDKCGSMIDDGNHRYHVAKAFMKLEPMLLKRAKDLTQQQSVALTYNLRIIIRKLENLTLSEKALGGTEACRISFENCIGKLIE